MPPLLHKLRQWDQLSVSRVDTFIANSKTVQDRITKYYHRDSTIIFPPVSTEHFFVADHIDNYFVTGGRLVPYKRFDLIINVFNRLGWPLYIFGTGPEFDRLKNQAKSNIIFLGHIDDKEKARVLAHAQAFIHPQVEDFGITPLESMMCGRPVIAYNKGGALETIIDRETGLFFEEQTWECLYEKVKEFKTLQWNTQKIRSHAERFSIDEFKKHIQNFVSVEYQKFKKSE